MFAITLNVIVSNTTTVKMITEGAARVSIWPKIDYVICKQSFTAIQQLHEIKFNF